MNISQNLRSIVLFVAFSLINSSTLTAQTVCVVGVGYVGLPTALLAAKAGLNVHAYDTNAEKITDLQTGETIIAEADLKELLKANINNPLLVFSTEPIEHADVYVIAVPTPFLETKEVDSKHVWQAVKTICPLLKKGSSVLFASTMSVFLTNAVAEYIQEQTGLHAGQDVFIAYCPEPLLPGNILNELSHNPRILGGITPACANHADAFYRTFVSGSFYHTNARSAELVKLIENSWRNVQIAFVNQIDQMCTTAGVESREIIDLANRHPRVQLLQPGCGVGGSGMGIDPWVLIKNFPKETVLILLARVINDERPHVIAKQAFAKFEEIIEKSPAGHISIGIWGVTFKPNVTDIRQSPALQIAQILLKKNDPRITFHIVEPHTSSELEAALGVAPETNPQNSLQTCDGIISLVKHDQFSHYPYEILQNKIVLDACGLLYEARKNTPTSL